VVPSGLTTTAYGIAFCMQNSMLFISPIIAGLIIDSTQKYSGGYFWVTLYFFALGFCGAIVGIIIMVLDNAKNSHIYRGVPVIEDNNVINHQ